MSDHLNDEAVEALLSGHERDQPLGALLASIADHYGTIEPAAPGPELAAFISTGGTDDVAVVDLGARRRRKGAIIAAVTGTVIGKVLIGVSVAAASVAGMQASGIVDVPMLPDTHHRVVVERPEPTTTTQPTTSTSVALPTPVVTTLPVDPLDDSSDEPAAKAGPLVANTPLPKPVDPAGQHDQDHHDAVVDSTDGETVGDNGSHDGSPDDGDHSGNDERSDERLSERNDAAPSEKRTIDSTVPRSDHENTDATPNGADDHTHSD
jgi:hypothetical protein